MFYNFRRKDFIFYLILGAFNITKVFSQTFTQYVDPMIGTAGNGHTFPGATAPFGLVQLSPDTDYHDWARSSGYIYADSTIIGFSHTHLSGTGVRDLNDLILMPFLGKVKRSDLFAGTAKDVHKGYRSKFSHASEIASPGYYAVTLEDDQIRAELTCSERVGMHRYTFPKSDFSNIVIDPIQEVGETEFWNTSSSGIVDVELKFINDSTIVGYKHSTGWATRQYFYFVIQFSKPFIDYGVTDWNEEHLYKTRFKSNKQTKGFVTFKTKANESIVCKVGISSVSIDGAWKNIRSEVPHYDFDKVKKDTENKWNKQLSKIQIEGTEVQKKIFYTAAYHLAIAPNVLSDVDGTYYSVYGNTTKKASGKQYYSTFSLWDTYRAAHPLFIFTNPDKVADFINSFLDFYEDKGYLPFWPLWGCETNCMIGNHAVPVIVDAYLKGIKGFDVERAYKAVYESSIKPSYKSEVDVLHQYGYLPSDIIHEDAVSKALEHSYNDWCVAQFAKALNKTKDYEFFTSKSYAYKNLYDKQLGFMRGKNADGSWHETKNFNPNKFDMRYYTEATAWQYLWYVPQDVYGLIDLMGGKEKFAQKLDSMFKLPSNYEGFRADITGLIGQYAHGNEPSHHIPYLFNYAGKPKLTQYYTHKIINTQYSDKVDGLCGNEDCGQMSAWYLFSSIGMYPQNPCGGIYDLTAPSVNQAKILLENGKMFEIKVKNPSIQNRYVKSVRLNGKPIIDWKINHQQILAGGILEFELMK
ncbi:MAG: glycoside hydrolase family 92 protein [Cytophagales bacterium]|nr:MAG: glycoside hydrolase family 92 protein [Cytophagales bacterium]